MLCLLVPDILLNRWNAACCRLVLVYYARRLGGETATVEQWNISNPGGSNQWSTNPSIAAKSVNHTALRAIETMRTCKLLLITYELTTPCALYCSCTAPSSHSSCMIQCTSMQDSRCVCMGCWWWVVVLKDSDNYIVCTFSLHALGYTRSVAVLRRRAGMPTAAASCFAS
jgi:hypothetical protein